MNKALFIFSAITLGVSSFAQGTLIFKTLGIQKADGSGTYNVPLFANDGIGMPGWIGDVPPEVGLRGAGTLGGA
jgi:hypothetical protein